jgi:predicted GNAT family N-acyltransferase
VTARTDVVVEAVTAAETWPLRKRILRPHQESDVVVLPGDDDPRAAHIGARDVSGELVGVATVIPEACPWSPGRRDTWRLRGMATDEGRRSAGIGGTILRAALDHVRAHGGSLVWCNARESAVAFYEREGFSRAGEPYVDPELGPHLPMQREMQGRDPDG